MRKNTHLRHKKITVKGILCTDPKCSTSALDLIFIIDRFNVSMITIYKRKQKKFFFLYVVVHENCIFSNAPQNLQSCGIISSCNTVKSCTTGQKREVASGSILKKEPN